MTKTDRRFAMGIKALLENRPLDFEAIHHASGHGENCVKKFLNYLIKNNHVAKEGDKYRKVTKRERRDGFTNSFTFLSKSCNFHREGHPFNGLAGTTRPNGVVLNNGEFVSAKKEEIEIGYFEQEITLQRQPDGKFKRLLNRE